MLDKMKAKQQDVVISHPSGDDFKPMKKREHLFARDLGVLEGTKGQVNAMVVRAAHPFREGQAGGKHRHSLDFQMMYVLKGYQTMDLGEKGIVRMTAGTCWTQPPNMVHEVLDYSDDFECIVIDLPADYETTEV